MQAVCEILVTTFEAVRRPSVQGRCYLSDGHETSVMRPGVNWGGPFKWAGLVNGLSDTSAYFARAKLCPAQVREHPSVETARVA